MIAVDKLVTAVFATHFQRQTIRIGIRSDQKFGIYLFALLLC